ncbi:MAG TPA: PfkB family carbohydrate kinase [Vicinamibacterales bacterium]|nr:PfkB family carbohydrate kinase [Vicinamibacterales bacterium]
MRLGLKIPAAGSKPFDVAGFGLNSIDLLAVVAEYPVSNSKQRLQRFMHMPGGQIATALSVCAKLGLTATYVGSFGADPLGKMSRDSLLDAGVDISGSRIVEGATNQFAVILVDARSGERTVLWDRHPALTFEPKDVPRAAVTAGRVLIVDCHETAAATQAARCAREAGVPTIIDVEKVRPGIGELLQQIDVLITAQDFPCALTGHEEIGRALDAMAEEFPSARLVCATLGDEGSLSRCNGREIHTPAFQVDCVDSTGAGDAFRGAFAAGCLLMPDAEVEDVLRYANAVAALNCRALGARGGLPTRDEVDQLLGARQRVGIRPM